MQVVIISLHARFDFTDSELMGKPIWPSYCRRSNSPLNFVLKKQLRSSLYLRTWCKLHISFKYYNIALSSHSRRSHKQIQFIGHKRYPISGCCTTDFIYAFKSFCASIPFFPFLEDSFWAIQDINL
jgi:hypothetical protein